MPATKRRKGKRRKPETPPLTRSEVMSRVRSKNTKPELAVRKALWAAGFRYRLYNKKVPGNPDLLFGGKRIAVFVHGCFWHCHENCPRCRIPKSRIDWWTAKLRRNQQRDVDVRAQLESAGWRVFVIWECESERPDAMASFIRLLSESMKHPLRANRAADVDLP